MASSRQSLDTDIIVLRQIYARTAINQVIPSTHILISNGGGAAYWDSISSIFPISSFNAVRGTNGSTFYADQFNNILNVSTIGPQGLLESYVDPATSTLVLSNAAPTVQVALQAAPNISRIIASNIPIPETISFSTNQTTLKFIGVRDVLFSTVTDLRTIFVSISSFTSQGYADLSAECRAWRPYTYSTNSTSAGYATFMSSIPISTSSWNWNPFLTSNVPLSTIDAYPYYSTGDVYFSTVTFNMTPYIPYINPNSTTKVFLETQPNYFFPRFFLGSSPYPNLIKNMSTFIQYQTTRTGPQVMNKAFNIDYIMSQQSNAFCSNYFTRNMKLEMDTAVILSNWAADGPSGYYTLYHRIPGGMANIVGEDGCAMVIGPRGGMSNAAPTYDNRTPLSNGNFIHIYNQNASAPPFFTLGSN